ncbi:MAG: N-acetylmuramoyl-L-alanine amidase, partial [Clostridia bacterium]|nr:N-acetylmuramoyl-L-alanine amidase [Clostridia bacterium]
MCINKLVVWILVAVSMVGVLAIPTVLSSVNRDVKTVVIDPGHGGLDSGVSSENGVKESDVVLLIARVLGEYLESGGFNVVLTRKNQSALIGGRFVKKTDMERRVEIIKKASPQLVI